MAQCSQRRYGDILLLLLSSFVSFVRYLCIHQSVSLFSMIVFYEWGASTSSCEFFHTFRRSINSTAAWIQTWFGKRKYFHGLSFNQSHDCSRHFSHKCAWFLWRRIGTWKSSKFLLPYTFFTYFFSKVENIRFFRAALRSELAFVVYGNLVIKNAPWYSIFSVIDLSHMCISHNYNVKFSASYCSCLDITRWPSWRMVEANLIWE